MKFSRSTDVFMPLDQATTQAFLGRGIHTLGLLRWILEQVGKADVYVSTFSTSDDFLSGFLRLRKDNLVEESFLLADIKAARKTLQLASLMQNCFSKVCLAPNHSKIVLVKNDKYCVSVITSQNQTYGDRHESTVVTTDKSVFNRLLHDYLGIINDKSVNIQHVLERRQLSSRVPGED